MNSKENNMSGNILPIDLEKSNEGLMKHNPVKMLNAVAAAADTYMQSHTETFVNKIETSEAKYTEYLNALEKAPSDPVALSNVQRSLSALQMMINAQTNAIKKFTDNAMAIINNFR